MWKRTSHINVQNGLGHCEVSGDGIQDQLICAGGSSALVPQASDAIEEDEDFPLLQLPILSQVVDPATWNKTNAQDR